MQLFDESEMCDMSPYAINKGDTAIVKASKLFAARTILDENQPAGLMAAFQAGAEEARKRIVRIFCKDCPNKGDCEVDDCDFYNDVLKLFKK